MSEIHIIKRYQNHKLYDATSHYYVTLEDLAILIKEGKDFKVFDHRTKQDITYRAKIHIIFNKELSMNRESEDHESLNDIIKNDSSIL